MQTDLWRDVVCFVSGCFSLTFNTLLAYIILTVKCVYIGKYKWLLFLYTLTAMVNGAAQMLTLPHIFATSSGYVFYDSLHLLPPYIADCILMVYASCFTQTLVILTICFIYRYYAVCNPGKLVCFLKNWRKIALISVIVVILVTSALFYSFERSTHCEELMNAEFINATGVSLTEIGYLGSMVFTKTGLNMKMLVVLWIYGILSLGAGFTMIKLALRIAKTLKSSSATSETITKHQKRIFALLMFQLVLPLLFNVCPQQIVIVSLYFHIDARFILHILCCCLTGAQVFDPLVTFYLITPYRMALLEKIFRLKNSTRRESPTVTVAPLSTK